ncbi:MAG: DivIVA domain-containing protein [Deinococcus sp.]|nr:DivIVA domain-containing protein [Deinococcus sp.]
MAAVAEATVVGLNPLEVKSKEFRRGRGYLAEEVRSYLETLANDLAKLLDENRRLLEMNRQQAAQVQEQLDRIHELEKNEAEIKAALLRVDNLSGQLRANAEREGALIVREAKLRSEDMINEARRQVQEIIAKGEREVHNLQRDIDQLSRNRALLKNRIQVMLQPFLEIINEPEVPHLRLPTPAAPRGLAEGGTGSEEVAEAEGSDGSGKETT